MAIELDIQKNFKGFSLDVKTEGAGWTYRDPGRFRKRKEYDSSQYCRN